MTQRSAGKLGHLAQFSATDFADRTGLRVLSTGSFGVSFARCMLAGSFNDFGLGRVATISLAGVGHFTSCAAGGRRRNLALIPVVTQRGNLVRLGCSAHCAGVSHFTCFGAGGFFGDFALIPLVFSTNYLILTRAAVRAGILADTSGSAGGLLQRRSQHIVVCFGVDRNRSGLLQNCFAGGADDAAGGASSRAGGGNFFHCYRRMAGGRSQFAQIITLKDFTTDRTLHNALAVLRAGRLYHLGLARRMTQCIQRLFFCVVAAAALQRHTAGLGAGRFHQALRILLQIVAQGSLRDFLHFAFGRTAVLADHANLCILRAGCVHQALLKVMLAGGWDLLVLCLAADRAGVLRLAGLAAGGFLHGLGQFPGVFGGNDCILCSIAIFTREFAQTIRRAGGRLQGGDQLPGMRSVHSGSAYIRHTIADELRHIFPNIIGRHLAERAAGDSH